ncbi:hypothetical protein ABB37_09664 [Leptomonas pyrrhocoris]|uniref:C2 domain-containing protein n=1 Tax=Leptomonas pyrrhocoris TaxID=157538 RepID=A0A0M9FQG0_LEPPY|nr:hypothetical protein ABB37_09664 [Leptomonas pyrrhocoris]KPA73776.1 hypothetical protein ABB37_09664 [Leptomonas pyrrhocoris]|eukprot:XP_015652215.1 hypothetical protein ABB37_09664 [Leptomonas pyrrhocoris]
MNPSTVQPAPVFSSTIEVPHLGRGAEGSAAPPPPQQQQRSQPTTADLHPSPSAPPPRRRPPDAFTVSDASADPLLAGLQLAQQRLAFHLSNAADTSFYHGAAVTSLLVPVEPPPPPPLLRDVVDAVEVPTTAKDNVSNNNADVQLTAETAGDTQDGKHPHHHHDAQHKAHTKRRHVSRRQRVHARRVEAALNPAFVIEMRERMPTQAQRSSPAKDVAVLSSHSTSSSNSSRSASSADAGGDNGELTRTANQRQSSRQRTKKSASEAAGGGDRGQDGQQRRGHRSGAADTSKRRSRRQRQDEEETDARRQTGASGLDAHLREIPPAETDGAVAAEGETTEMDQHQERRKDEDYRPDDDDASDFIDERMRLLQHDGTAADGAGTDAFLLKGYAAHVRPAEPFQRGPVPAWVQRYSNSLLFDAHRLDHRDAAKLQQMLAVCEGWGRLDRHVRLPVDAVVMRLRGDIARARRLRDALLQGERGVRRFLYSDSYAGRYEVYHPAEMDWTAGRTATGSPQENLEPQDSANGEVEMQAAVPAKIAEPSAPPSSAGPDEHTVIVVPASDEPPHVGGGNGNTRSTTKPKRSASTPSPRHTPLLLSRELEAKDLQRPLLAQTIPVWRRRGAAVKLIGELIDFLEDRLRVFGKQLDDPTHGPALELIGAPDFSGVDGSVRCTYPPALERALRTTITNTLLGDVFATPRSALGGRALRLSEALRRRQTPCIHDVYVTQLDYRPVFDYTAVYTARPALHGYASTGAGEGGHARGTGSANAASTSAGTDTRKSYSIHVDYVRFQPSLENFAVNALRRGHLTNAPPAAARRPPSLQLSSSADDFSSVLLGSYVNILNPSEAPGAGGGVPATGQSARAAHQQPQRDDDDREAGRRGSLGTDDAASTTAALLLALSRSASQDNLVAFSPEEYLISLLLRYYEQYRMLQLNLLPFLKNRFFYQEQLAQLQRQPHRSTELNQLQARLEKLAETSANVERGCLHVMILLWNAVLEQRRRRRQQRRIGLSAVQLDDGVFRPTDGTWMYNQEAEGHADEDDEDPPILIEHRAAAQGEDRGGRGSHNHDNGSGRRRRRGGGSAQAGEGHSAAPPMTPEEHRAHPPLFDDEWTAAAPAPVVHSVNDTATYSEGAADTTNRKQKKNQNTSSSGVHNAASTLPLLFSPSVPDAGAASASASPLLAPPSAVSSASSDRHDGGRHDHPTSAAGAGDVDLPWAASPTTAPAVVATRFRFFLRRYGTVQEVPYGMGDDLLWYAAEVEGTDVTPTEPARGATKAGTSTAHRRSTPSADAVTQDDLLYFQLVVFARSHAAIVPQYVGCTTPRPMTTAKVVFFNETFEVRALHEPAELLLHLIPVTAGPSKRTVVSTVRLRPTLTRRYTLLPLQPPTAFMFQGKLFTRSSNQHNISSSSTATATAAAAASKAGGVSMLAAAPVSGVLAVSTTWTSQQGLTIGQIEEVFLRGGRGGGAADPLDPQYLPLLRTLRTYYVELDSTRAHVAQAETPERATRRGRRDRRAAVQERRGTTTPTATLGPKASFRAAGRSVVIEGGRANGGLAGCPASLSTPANITPMMVMAAAAGARDYAVEEVQLRLPTLRLQYLFRRWLVRIGRIKPADEVESRLLERPIPLSDADAYVARKRVLRLVEKEEEARNDEYAASGAQFDAKRYYKAPSAISGLALSNLPRETRLKLWQERQRRLLLTLKANRHASDAEKLEAIVKVPKLMMKLVFDFAPRSQLNPHRKVRPKTEDIDRALLKRRRDSRIVIHIMKAHNLPYRADGTPLEPFVQATFVSEAAYTRSEVGSSPSWFETVELPFQPLDFEEDTLSMIDDDLVLSLYDKVEVKMAPSAATTAAVAHETHYRAERRFIGTLRIPFYSLHQASEARMEGVYPLRTPRWLLGYDLPSASAEQSSRRGLDGPFADADRGSDEGATQGNPFGTAPFVSATGGKAGGEGGGGGGMLSPSSPFSPAAADATAATTVVTEEGSSTAFVRAATAATTTDVAGVHEQQASEPTVQLYVSLWPPLQRDAPKKLSKAELHRSVHQLFVSPELHYLHRVALRWQQTALQRVQSIAAMNAQATTRQIDPFVECSTGDLVLVCRYMLPRGGPPPPSVRTVYEAIRYVSLLPFVADMMSFGEKDVWSTNAELLAMRSGDYEELALLLVHFLRHLAPDRPTYAVVGSGSIYQQTIMVLHEFDDNELYLIDPRSGWTVPAGKPYGTLLRDVYMVISHAQLWANTQLSGLPHRMTWDLHNPTHWLPCFDSVKDRRIPVCLPHLIPIQREVLDFPAADAVKARAIEVELRACLKRALLTWRNGCPPAYHRGVETILRELLEAAEEERCSCGSARRTDITRSAAARLSEYFGESVTGSPASAQDRHPHQQRENDMKDEQGREAATSPRKRRHHHSRHRQATANAEEAEGAHGRAGSPPPGVSSSMCAAAAALRVLGSPVMGSFNPADPQFEELLQQVFEGAVHEVGTNEVSFAAGVYVKSYTGDVCAMWVFLVAICRG